MTNILLVAAVVAAVILAMVAFNGFSLRRTHEFLARRKEFFLFVGSVGALGYTLFEYNEAKERGRIEKTLELLQDYREKHSEANQSRIDFAHRLMLDLQLCRDTTAPKDAGLEAACSAIADDKENVAVGTYIFSMLMKDGAGKVVPGGKSDHAAKIVDSIIDGATFLSEFGSCVEQGLCSRKVACDNMGAAAYTFHLNFKGYFVEHHKIWYENPGAGIDRFLDACGLTPPGDGKEQPG